MLDLSGVELNSQKILYQMTIEQDADLIMLMYRDDYYDKEKEYKDITEIQIAKHWNGPIGGMGLRFLKGFGKFVGEKG